MQYCTKCQDLLTSKFLSCEDVEALNACCMGSDSQGRSSSCGTDSEEDSSLELEVPKKRRFNGSTPPKKRLRKDAQPNQSKYIGVVWGKNKKWKTQVFLNGKNYHCGMYSDDLEAAKAVNQMCDNIGVPRKNPGIGVGPIKRKSEKRIVFWDYKYVGIKTLLGDPRRNGSRVRTFSGSVIFHERKYTTGHFKTEKEAAQALNDLADRLGLEHINPGIGTIPSKFRPSHLFLKSVKFKGVIVKDRRFCASLEHKGVKHEIGSFCIEAEAAFALNAKCVLLGIPMLNPEVGIGPRLHLPEKGPDKSIYLGVESGRSRNGTMSWIADFADEIVGEFQYEILAAKAVNGICDKHGLPRLNPGVGILTQKEARGTSKYHGVFWDYRVKKWGAVAINPEGEQKWMGHYNDEVDAAKAVNTLCREYGMDIKNPQVEIGTRDFSTVKECQRIAELGYKGVKPVRFNYHKRLHSSILRDVKFFYEAHIESHYCGKYKTPMEAAQAANAKCDELGKKHLNPGLGVVPLKIVSHDYVGVFWEESYWNKFKGKWNAKPIVIDESGKRRKPPGLFETPLLAAQALNRLCVEHGLSLKNVAAGLGVMDSKLERPMCGHCGQENSTRVLHPSLTAPEEKLCFDCFLYEASHQRLPRKSRRAKNFASSVEHPEWYGFETAEDLQEYRELQRQEKRSQDISSSSLVKKSETPTSVVNLSSDESDSIEPLVTKVERGETSPSIVSKSKAPVGQDRVLGLSKRQHLKDDAKHKENLQSGLPKTPEIKARFSNRTRVHKRVVSDEPWLPEKPRLPDKPRFRPKPKPTKRVLWNNTRFAPKPKLRKHVKRYRPKQNISSAKPSNCKDQVTTASKNQLPRKDKKRIPPKAPTNFIVNPAGIPSPLRRSHRPRKRSLAGERYVEERARHKRRYKGHTKKALMAKRRREALEEANERAMQERLRRARHVRAPPPFPLPNPFQRPLVQSQNRPSMNGFDPGRELNRLQSRQSAPQFKHRRDLNIISTPPLPLNLTSIFRSSRLR